MGELFFEDPLCPFAKWAVGLGEYDDLVVGDGFFDGVLEGHGCSWRGGDPTGEERPDCPVKYALGHLAYLDCVSPACTSDL